MLKIQIHLFIDSLGRSSGGGEPVNQWLLSWGPQVGWGIVCVWEVALMGTFFFEKRVHSFQ